MFIDNAEGLSRFSLPRHCSWEKLCIITNHSTIKICNMPNCFNDLNSYVLFLFVGDISFPLGCKFTKRKLIILLMTCWLVVNIL